MNWMPREAVRIEQSSLREHQERIALNVISTIWRRRWIIVGLVIFALAAALLALSIMDREYRSDAVIRLEFHANQGVGLAPQTPSAAIDASALVESEARTIRSHAMAYRVASRLNLENDPDFTPRSGLIKRLLGMIGLNLSPHPTSPLDSIATQLVNELSVFNDNRSYLITISYTSQDREKAAVIANAFADEYIQSRIEAEEENAEQTRRWLASQMEEKRAALAMLERAYLVEMNQIDIKAREARRASLEGQINTIRDSLRNLTEQHDSVRSLLALKQSSAKQVILAKPAHSQSYPKPLVVLGTALTAALGVGVGLAFLLERRDTGLRSDLEVLAATGVPCLGIIPEIKRRSSPTERFALSVAVQDAAASAGLNDPSSSPKVAIIGSAAPREGKSFFIEALTRDFVTSGRRVLIVDATPRAASHGVEHAPSLEAVLTDSASRTAFFTERQSETSAAICRSSGLAKDHDIFFTSAFKEFVQEARVYYDRILIEIPPVLLVAEPWLLDVNADAFVLVARWNSTPRAAIKAALQRLGQRSTYVTGIVLTRVILSKHKDYFIADRAHFLRKYMRHYKATV